MFTAIQIYRQTAIYAAQSDTTIQPGLGYRYTHTFYTHFEPFVKINFT